MSIEPPLCPVSHELAAPAGGGLPALRVQLDGVILSGTLDPARLEREVPFLLEHGRHPDLQTAATVVIRWLQLAPTGVGATYGTLTLTLTPAGGRSVAVTLEPAPYEREPDKTWGWVDIIHETDTVGFYRLTLEGGGVLPTHDHAVMEEIELVVDDGLEGWWDGSPATVLQPGRRLPWRHGQPHGYRHRGGPGPASLLCIDTPPFDPADERILGEEPPP